MKRLFISALCLLSLSQLTLANEIATKASGEEVILLNTGTWISREKAERIRGFEEVVDIEIVQINKKSKQYRTLAFKVTNNSRDALNYVAFGVKFKFGEEYSLRKIISVNNVASGESVDLQRQISVQDIEGRDVIIEVIDFSF